MKTFIIYLPLLLSPFFLVVDCYPTEEDENHHLTVHFENRWDKPIYFDRYMNYHWEGDCRDSVFLVIGDTTKFVVRASECLFPGDIDSEKLRKREYYEFYEYDDTLVVQIYNPTIPDATRYESLLAAYLLSTEDLQKLKFHLSYPPSEELRKFRIYLKEDIEGYSQTK